MITFWTYKRAMGVPNPSPFCMKVESCLRLRGMEYKPKVLGDPRKAPKGKLPVIEDGGTVIPDSEFILAHLEKKYAPGLDAGLSDRDRAIAHTVRRTLEENFYWAIVYSRWIAPETWPQIKQVWFGPLPPVLRDLIAGLVRRQTTRDLKGHGMGRHSAEAIYVKAADDLAAVAQLLGDKPYFLGDRPRTIDATVYAFVANGYHLKIRTPLRDLVAAHPNLSAYCDRMRDALFSNVK